MNGQRMSIDDARKWMEQTSESSESSSSATGGSECSRTTGASEADLVVISLQECPTCPNVDVGTRTRTGTNANVNGYANFVNRGDEDFDFSPPLYEYASSSDIPCIRTLGVCHNDRGGGGSDGDPRDFPPSQNHDGDDDHVRDIFSSILSTEHTLLADLAMGKPPSTSISHHDGKVTKWYGYIRLIVWIKSDIMEYINKRVNHHHNHSHRNRNHCSPTPPSVIPILVPAGTKRMMDIPKNYNKPLVQEGCASTGTGTTTIASPDKGGVCLAIPCLRILLCSLHLCGTNAYHTPEDVFDTIRIREWNTIMDKCSSVLREEVEEEVKEVDIARKALSGYEYIICGDLNFRVEMFEDPVHKSRGGRDYQSVVSTLLEKDGGMNMNELFWNNDRLVRLLQSVVAKSSSSDDEEMIHEQNGESGGGGEGEDHDNPTNTNTTRVNTKMKDKLTAGLSAMSMSVLRNLIDSFMMHFPSSPALASASASNGKQDEGIFPPTFTFQMDGCNKKYKDTCAVKVHHHPRIYSDKRTPSWPDRILISKGLLGGIDGDSDSDGDGDVDGDVAALGKYKLEACGAEYSITSSDHAPVFVTLCRER